jgi:hypothetical protein
MSKNQTPIAVISYNRTAYLIRTLKSIAPQVSKRPIYLFLDGPRNLQDLAAINISEQQAKKIIPQIKILRAEKNLGVGWHQKKMREYMFERYDKTSFIEDDMELNQGYFNLLDSLLDEFEDNDEIAIVSGFGGNTTKHCNHLFKQEQNKFNLVPCDHTISIAMWAKKYEKIKPILDPYYALIPGEYRARPHEKIRELFQEMGAHPSVLSSSQDNMIVLAFLSLGYYKISTYTNNLEYFGEYGEHSRPQDFQRYAFNSWPRFNTLEYFEKNLEKKFDKPIKWKYDMEAIKQEIEAKYYHGKDPIAKYLLKI